MQLFRLFLQVLLIYYLAPADLILVFYAVGVSLRDFNFRLAVSLSVFAQRFC